MLNTVLLGVVALAFAFAVGIPFGIIAAVRRGGGVDLIARLFALLGQAVPNFWLGLMLILFLAVNFDFLPTGGRVGITSFILPGITLGSFPAAAGHALHPLLDARHPAAGTTSAPRAPRGSTSAA